MADGIRATPYRYAPLGTANELIGGLLGYLRDPRRTQQMQGLAGLLESTGIPKTVERLAYGEPLTNLQQANVPALRPETAEALLTLLPVPSGANKAAMAAGRAGERLAERVVPQIMERGGMPAGLLEGMSSHTVSPLTVYHGSPAKFSKFDPTKIGSGEGAQAYGYGHYVAESPAVAKEYRDKLTVGENYVNGELFDAYNPKHYLASALSENSGNVAEAKDFLEFMASSGGSKSIKDTAKSALDLLKKGESPKLEYVKPSGSFYEIDLPDEQIAKMLDWDKPLSKQPKNVQAALEKLGYKVDRADVDKYSDALLDALMTDAQTNLPKQPLDMAGEALYRKLGNPEQAAKRLREAGIPGIRYLDQGSRGADEGTSNFVVFPGNEDLLTILKRNGGLLEPQPKNFESSVTDASEIFGEGAKRIKYTDPNSGGVIDVLQRPDGSASVLGLEVPEAMRGQGIGQSLQSQVMQDFPEMMGQVSSRAAAKTAYRLGRRPPNQPDATLDDVYKIMDEYSSVNLVSPEMQKRFMQSLLD